MSLIEGVGDEVIQFLGFLLVTVIGFVAWWSTGIRERPQIRTVLILEHRPSDTTGETSQDFQSDTNNVSNQAGATDNTPAIENETSVENDQEDNARDNAIEQRQIENENETVEFERRQGEDESDRDSNKKNFITEKRLAYFGSLQPNSINTANPGSSDVHQGKQEEASTDSIRIRLKYLNDDQKLVDGKLEEPLGDFKRRHFSGELSADKLVRLIFNGQVLQCDYQTLQSYGLYDNCVVHCLVHAQRRNVNRTNSQQQANANPPECNLGIILYATVSVILGLAWFFRYYYSQFFTIFSTVGLIVLTTIYGVIIIVFHLTDHETVPVQ